MNTREVTRQYRLNKWTEIVRECRSSGQTVAAWCTDRNINPKQYYYWLKCVRTAACESLQVIESEAQSFVPVKMPDNLIKASPTAQVLSPIILRMGAVTLELHNGASAELITNTVRALTHVR